MMRTMCGMLALVLVTSTTLSDDAKAFKSGPQAGDNVPGAFHPLNLTGEFAGEKHCLFCQCGDAPVAMIFARQLTPEFTKLIKAIDAQTAKNNKAGMASFVVFLSNDGKLPDQIKALAKKENIKHTILSIDTPVGPERYKISKDAEVTVVLYNEFKVEANHTFRKGELSDKAIAQVVASVPKILPKK